VKLEPSPFLWEPIQEQAWTGPQRKEKQSLLEENDDNEESDEEDSSQAGLREKTAPAASGAGRTEQWGTNQVRRAIERASLHCFTRSSTRRSGGITCPRSFSATSRTLDPAVLKTLRYGDREVDDAESDPFDLQSTHTSKSAGQVYGRPADESPWSVQSKRKDFRRVSLAWHQSLQFISTLSVNGL
jgi:hypothetical protein